MSGPRLGDAQSFREFELRLVALAVGFVLWIALLIVVLVSGPVPASPGTAAAPSAPPGAAATP